MQLAICRALVHNPLETQSKSLNSLILLSFKYTPAGQHSAYNDTKARFSEDSSSTTSSIGGISNCNPMSAFFRAEASFTPSPAIPR